MSNWCGVHRHMYTVLPRALGLGGEVRGLCGNVRGSLHMTSSTCVLRTCAQASGTRLHPVEPLAGLSVGNWHVRNCSESHAKGLLYLDNMMR